MTEKTTGHTRRTILKMGVAATTLPLFNINHAWSQDVAFDGKVFDAGGAVLRVGEWGGPWGELVNKYLLTDFQKEFNCKIEYDRPGPGSQNSSPAAPRSRRSTLPTGTCRRCSRRQRPAISS
ncbi:hypothetical protein [Rhizobium leguminosarum]|uniref:hypothetical protein n=1 Tax=Rhizobium leguminosarum TaxID=384 RepID=UPI001FE0FC93|nr:hypothetical protein [Rhizobium leguminosarum]